MSDFEKRYQQFIKDSEHIQILKDYLEKKTNFVEVERLLDAIVPFIKEERERVFQETVKRMEGVIGEDEPLVKLPVMQIQEQNNYDKQQRNELRGWQRPTLAALQAEGLGKI